MPGEVPLEKIVQFRVFLGLLLSESDGGLERASGKPKCLPHLSQAQV